jgi:uncharacterized protein
MTYLDAVHSTQVPSELQNLLSLTPEMQHTDNLKQLGLSVHVFRNAKHTRADHNIGVSLLASRFCEQLKVSEHERNIVEAAAILHDLGHLPFCHAAESYFRRHHARVQESNSVEIIRNSKRIQDILSAFDVPMDSVCDLIDKEKYTSISYMLQLISGTFDCDRLDYLMRDGRNTASHADAIKGNLDKILAGIAIYKGDIIGRNKGQIDTKKGVICYSHDSSECIINTLNAYASMYKDVYQNRNTASFEKMLRTALEMNHQFLTEESLTALYQMEEAEIISLLKEASTKEKKIVEYITEEIFDRKRPYKDIFALPNTQHLKETIKKLYSNYPEDKEERENILEEQLCTELNIPKGMLLVLTNEIPPEQYIPETDIFIKPYKGVYIINDSEAAEQKVIGIEQVIDLPLFEKKYAHKLAFRVIAAPDYQNDKSLTKKIKDIIL